MVNLSLWFVAICILYLNSLKFIWYMWLRSYLCLNFNIFSLYKHNINIYFTIYRQEKYKWSSIYCIKELNKTIQKYIRPLEKKQLFPQSAMYLRQSIRFRFHPVLRIALYKPLVYFELANWVRMWGSALTTHSEAQKTFVFDWNAQATHHPVNVKLLLAKLLWNMLFVFKRCKISL